MRVVIALFLFLFGVYSQRNIVLTGVTNGTVVNGNVTISLSATGVGWRTQFPYDLIDLVYSHRDSPLAYYSIQRNIAIILSNGQFIANFIWNTLDTVSSNLEDDDTYILTAVPGGMQSPSLVSPSLNFTSNFLYVIPNNFGSEAPSLSHNMNTLGSSISGIVTLTYTLNGFLSRKTSTFNFNLQFTCDISSGPFYIVDTDYLPRKGVVIFDSRVVPNAPSCYFIFNIDFSNILAVSSPFAVDNGNSISFRVPFNTQIITGSYYLRWFATGSWSGAQTLQAFINNQWTTITSNVTTIPGNNQYLWDSAAYISGNQNCTIRIVRNSDSAVLSTSTTFTVDNRETSTRSFSMGFSGWGFDSITSTPNVQSITDTYISQHADVFSYHLPGSDSIPWTEAYNGSPFLDDRNASMCNRTYSSLPVQFDDFQNRRNFINNRRQNVRYIVGLNPGRGGALARYWGCSADMPIPAPFNGMTLDNPVVIWAYYQYAKRTVEMLQLDEIVIGVESDGHFFKSLNAWNQWLNLHIAVYNYLKRDFPQLIVTSSLIHSSVVKHSSVMECVTRYSDYVSLSSYPYGNLYGVKQYACVGCAQDSIGDYLYTPDIYQKVGAWAKSLGKSWGQNEGGFPNGYVNASYYAFYASGTPFKQDQYMNNILADLNAYEARIIVNWAAINFLPLTNYIDSLGDPVLTAQARIWESIGLRNGVSGATSVNDLVPVYPSEATWDYFLNKPKRVNSLTTGQSGSTGAQIVSTGFVTTGAGSTEASSVGSTTGLEQSEETSGSFIVPTLVLVLTLLLF